MPKKLIVRHNRRSGVIPFSASIGNRHAAGASEIEAVISLMVLHLFNLSYL